VVKRLWWKGDVLALAITSSLSKEAVVERLWWKGDVLALAISSSLAIKHPTPI
jgi:hypothetical protein